MPYSAKLIMEDFVFVICLWFRFNVLPVRRVQVQYTDNLPASPAKSDKKVKKLAFFPLFLYFLSRSLAYG